MPTTNPRVPRHNVQVVKELGRYLDLRTAVLVGGDSMEAQFAELAAFPDILVATPGRLMHHLQEARRGVPGRRGGGWDELQLGRRQQGQGLLPSRPATAVLPRAPSAGPSCAHRCAGRGHEPEERGVPGV